MTPKSPLHGRGGDGDFRQGLCGPGQVQLGQQYLEFLLRLGVPRQADGSSVGRWQMHVHHLNRAKLFQPRVRRQSARHQFRSFEAKHGRRLQLEVEPGTYLVANSCTLIATVIDVVDTGRRGYKFLKVDTGMTEMLRPGMYGAQHPIEVVRGATRGRSQAKYVVVGHCCESGDVLTPVPGSPEGLQPRLLPETRIGDLVVFGGAGAYCSSMAAKNYNSFPEAAEVMISGNGSVEFIRKRQTLDQILQNEVMPAFLKGRAK